MGGPLVGTMIDVMLVLLILLFAINGYRQGFVVGLLSFAGFFGGALLGLQLAPIAADQFSDATWRVIVALFVVFALALLGQALAGLLGAHIRLSIRHVAAQVLDDIGGSVISVCAVLVVTWMVAAPLASSSIPGVASAVRNSAIIRGVDEAMPQAVRGVYDSLRDTLDTNGFPDVFAGLQPTDVEPVPPPDPELANSEVVQQAEPSVVKVLGDAPDCSRRLEGSGFVYAPERVMTNAHVVAGTERIFIEVMGEERYPGEVVVYDPDRDLAVIYVPGLDAPTMLWAEEEAQTDQSAIVLGYPLDGPYQATPARIRDSRNVRGPDIYDEGTVVREVYSIRSEVRSGNSGGPLISLTGEVYGVIFAAAADDPETGYALTADEAAPVADAGRRATTPVSTGPCT